MKFKISDQKLKEALMFGYTRTLMAGLDERQEYDRLHPHAKPNPETVEAVARQLVKKVVQGDDRIAEAIAEYVQRRWDGNYQAAETGYAKDPTWRAICKHSALRTRGISSRQLGRFARCYCMVETFPGSAIHGLSLAQQIEFLPVVHTELLVPLVEEAERLNLPPQAIKLRVSRALGWSDE